MENSYSDNPILNEIFDEEPTNPMIKLNSAASVVDDFLAAARVRGYDDDQYWTESVLDEVYHINDDDIMLIVEENA